MAVEQLAAEEIGTKCYNSKTGAVALLPQNRATPAVVQAVVEGLLMDWGAVQCRPTRDTKGRGLCGEPIIS